MNKIIKLISRYGVYPALSAMKDFEDREQYEMCAKIKNGIDEFNVRYSADLPTCTNSLRLVLVQTLLKFNNPALIESNMPHYVEEFKKGLAIDKTTK